MPRPRRTRLATRATLYVAWHEARCREFACCLLHIACRTLNVVSTAASTGHLRHCGKLAAVQPSNGKSNAKSCMRAHVTPSHAYTHELCGGYVTIILPAHRRHIAFDIEIVQSDVQP